MGSKASYAKESSSRFKNIIPFKWLRDLSPGLVGASMKELCSGQNILLDGAGRARGPREAMGKLIFILRFA